jgi:NAD(P)-dependent dehydrogenase (short-subunit alcohol dehydrogenase family)
VFVIMAKVWLITGSSRGLGRSLAEAVASAGHQLVATARRPEQLADLAARYPGQVLPVALDVADPAAARSAVHAAVERFGRLDVVVNNAGYADVASIEDVTLDDFQAQIDTDFYGVVYVTKAALPVLREQGSGHIIQISSVGGRVTSVGLAAYQSAKWAVEGFSGVLAQEVAPLGIKVTIIEPGGFRTDWAGSSMTIPPVSEPYQETVGTRVRMLEEHAGQQAGDPAKAAQVILQLTEIDDPPLRLLLGSDAVRYAAAADQARIESDARWRALSESTDHDDATAAQKDPLAGLGR